MNITPLASGSQGNSLLLESVAPSAGSETVRILIDAGLPIEELEGRLAETGVKASSITAVCVTHRHKDHIRGVADFCATYRTPVFGVRRTLRSLTNKLTKRMTIVPIGQPFRIGPLELRAVELPHDAPHTVGFVVDDGRHRFGHATDLGHVPDTLAGDFERLDAMLLEFNYDAEMLAASPYPRQLRDRIASDTGHLDNEQAESFLAQLDVSRLRHLWIGHVSRHNNRQDLALAAARRGLGTGYGGTVAVALQEKSSPTCHLREGTPTFESTASETR